jgi:hypothetical protein
MLPPTDRRRIIFTAAADARLVFAAAAGDGAAPAPDKIGTLAGYALVWNVLSSDRGGFKVRLLPGSARFADPTHALYHHEYTGGPLADTGTGTLRLFPDDVGVRVEIDLPNTTNGRDVAELVRTRRVRGMSFAMVGDPKFRETTEGGQPILEAESYLVDEVTVTAIPAFRQTDIGVKDAAAAGYAARTAQAIRLQQFKLDLYRLPGANPRRAV